MSLFGNRRGWTPDTWEAFSKERDRRYSEVAAEREKALKIKETADLAALELAREIQTYKDEKANQLREQINSERGEYAKHSELKATEDKIAALLKPLSDYVTAQTGQARGISQSWGVLLGVAGFGAFVLSLIVAFQGGAS